MSNELALAGTWTETTLALPPDLSYEDWEKVGDTLGRIGRAHQWWIGDWVNFGERAYGEKYDQVIDATGLEYQTISNCRWVASKIEFSRRRENLSFSAHCEVAALAPEEQEEWLARAEADKLSVQDLRRKIRESAELPAPSPPTGKYRCIVIDPPWPVEKIEREVRPNQVKHLDYRTMSLGEIAALPIPDLAADGCHVYLWVTHKLLPAGLDILSEWGAEYECSLTWVKPVGMTPFSWMYNSEHVLFGRIGSLPLERNGIKIAFDAAAGRHSAKPDEFYERVAQASPEPRLEMFARESHKGLTPWGNEVADAA